MNRQYHSSSRSTRLVAAFAAIVTVVVLFDFVATLGEPNAQTIASASATATPPVAFAAPAAAAA